MLQVTPSLDHSDQKVPAIEVIRLDAIHDANRLRPIDQNWVSALAAEVEAGGEPPPLVVRRPEPDEGISQEFILVAGGHRLAAYRLLGRAEVAAEVRSIGRLQARLVEIDENLFRHELNPLDRMIFLSERKAIYDLLHPEVTHGGNRRSSKGENKSQGLRLDPRRFTQEAAERCGLSERTVQAALALMQALTPEAVKILRGTATARNASELKRLAGEPADRQPVLARLLRDGEAASVALAKIATGEAPTGEGDPQEDLYRRIVSNWARLDAKGRKRFIEHAGLMEPTANYLRAHGRGRS